MLDEEQSTAGSPRDNDDERIVCEGCGSQDPFKFHEDDCPELVFAPTRRPSTRPSKFPSAA